MESNKDENRANDAVPEGVAMDSAIRIAELEEQLKAIREDGLRQLAEMDNQRKRLQRDVEAARKYGTEKLIADLLPACDGLEAGLKAESADATKLRQGMEMTLGLLVKALDQHGLGIVDPAGQPFDSALHQAVSMVPTRHHAPGTVVTVFQKGYRLSDRLLRPALVAVAAEPAPPEDD